MRLLRLCLSRCTAPLLLEPFVGGLYGARYWRLLRHCLSRCTAPLLLEPFVGGIYGARYWRLLRLCLSRCIAPLPLEPFVGAHLWGAILEIASSLQAHVSERGNLIRSLAVCQFDFRNHRQMMRDNIWQYLI
jgi:hypothetical protein